jgi:hypothetical protein
MIILMLNIVFSIFYNHTEGFFTSFILELSTIVMIYSLSNAFMISKDNYYSIGWVAGAIYLAYLQKVRPYSLIKRYHRYSYFMLLLSIPLVRV